MKSIKKKANGVPRVPAYTRSEFERIRDQVGQAAAEGQSKVRMSMQDALQMVQTMSQYFANPDNSRSLQVRRVILDEKERVQAVELDGGHRLAHDVGLQVQRGGARLDGKKADLVQLTMINTIGVVIDEPEVKVPTSTILGADGKPLVA